MPHIPRFLDCRLLAQHKPTGGLRPIAIAETWQRLVSLCAMALCSDLGPSLLPLQLGVGVSGGAQSLGHAARAALAAWDGVVLVQLDWKNAFNTMSRAAILQAVAVHAPRLLPLVKLLYRYPAQLHVEGAPSDTPAIASQRGVRQGDPISGLLFALTLQGALQTVQQQHQPEDARPTAALKAYHDDCTIASDAEHAPAAFRDLVAAAAPLGLEPQLPKCTAYSRDPQHAATVASELEITHAVHGTTVCGTPIGTPAYEAASAAASADKVCAAIDRLISLPLPSQDQFLLLTMSLQRRMLHLARVVPWGQVSGHVRRAEASVKAAVNQIMRIPRDDGRAAEQVILPTRLGGLGLLQTTQQIADAAYVAAAAVSHAAFRDAPECFRAFCGPQGETLQALWGGLKQEFRLWDAAASPADQAAIASVLPRLQQDVTKAVATRRRAALLAAFDITTPPGQRALARLHSCAGRPASIWLDTLPVVPALRMTSVEFSFSLRYRNGIPPAPPNALGVMCVCNTYVPPDDLDHAMNCKTLSYFWTVRHNQLESAWRQTGSRAGVATSRLPNTRAFVRAAREQRLPGGPAAPAALDVQRASQEAGTSGADASQAPEMHVPAPEPQGVPPLGAATGGAQDDAGPEHGNSGPLGARAQEEVGDADGADVDTSQEGEPDDRHVVDDSDKIGDILFIPPDSNLCIGDVSVINPSADSYRRQAARTVGAAAARRDRDKDRAYRRHDPDAYDFVPLSHESYGRMSPRAMEHLNHLADVAVRCGEVRRAVFVTNALRRLSVALCKGNALIFRMGMHTLAGITGGAVVHGCARPNAHP